MRTWLKLDVLVMERIRDLSTAEKVAYLTAVTAATWQPMPGTFRDQTFLKAELERIERGLSRCIGRLIETGRLTESPSGELVVKRWHEWQSADSGAERTARWRTQRDAERHTTSDAERHTLGDAAETGASHHPVTQGAGLEVEVDREVEQSVTPPTSQRQDVGERYRAIIGDDPEPPGSFMSFRRKAKPGEHIGQHGRECLVCAAMLDEAETAPGRRSRHPDAEAGA